MKRLKLFQKLGKGFQIEIDPETYADPYCTTHSETGMLHAYNLYRLIDNIPTVGGNYLATVYSFSKTYANIIEFAEPQNEMSKKNFSEAKGLLLCDEIARLSMYSKEFYLIETKPYKFWDYKGVDVEINLSPYDCGDGKFISLEVKEDTIVTYQDAQIVEIGRPWFVPEIFLSSKWGVDDYDPAEISDGTASIQNTGILPLIPTHMVLSRVIEDKHFDYPFLVGVISDVVPMAPILRMQTPLRTNDEKSSNDQNAQVGVRLSNINSRVKLNRIKLLAEQ